MYSSTLIKIDMNVNYLVVGAIVLVLLILLILFLKRNRKDEKELRNDLNQNELEEEQYKEDKA